MIPFDFDYYLPDTIDEAVETYGQLELQNLQPLYYAGGTEIISMARVSNISTKAVIDLKNIGDCNIFGIYEDQLIMGSCVTLSRITESKVFPLLAKAAGRIADHTNQCKITLGGNLNATIIYRETALPLLLSDSTAVIASKKGLREAPFAQVFYKRLILDPGEFLVQLKVKAEFLSLPYFHIKKTKNEKIDYPLISLAAILQDDQLHLALSGVCSYPFRSVEMEKELNRRDTSPEERVDQALKHLPEPPLNDIYGSDKYRHFVLKNTLIELINKLEA